MQNNLLTVIILTYNEEKNIEKCINSVKDVAKDIYVVDSYSTDKTVELANKLGAHVIQNKFINQAQQYKFAMQSIDIQTPWVMRLDADERLTEKSREEIVSLIVKYVEDDAITGVMMRFEISFMGKKLKHGGVYPFKKLIVYKHGCADIENKAMDEHIYLTKGKYVEAKYDCEHEDFKDIFSWIEKHNKYSSREVQDYFNNNVGEDGIGKEISKKQKQKYGLYYKLPLFVRAKLYYWYRKYIKMAWLDGKEGKIYAFLQAYWYRFIVDTKIFEKLKDKK